MRPSGEPERRVRLAVTLGDPRGIGPEVARAAAERVRVAGLELVLVGPAGTPADGADAPHERIGAWQAGGTAAEAGRLAGAAVEHATRMALRGDVAGIVTAPLDKQALHAGGFAFPGHTEMLAELSGADAVGMLMTAERTRIGGPLRVLLATTHLPLAAVPAALDATLLLTQMRLLDDGLREQWGLRQPKLALCALNPHASDGGLFGDEEARVLEPAVRRAREAGLDVAGPLPADTVFVRALRGEFDAVVAPYHDVGMAAFKTASFGQGVNVTLGLPFVRTSPDHGTALDIAGTGRADPASMEEAVRLAAGLVRARRAAHSVIR